MAPSLPSEAQWVVSGAGLWPSAGRGCSLAGSPRIHAAVLSMTGCGIPVSSGSAELLTMWRGGCPQAMPHRNSQPLRLRRPCPRDVESLARLRKRLPMLDRATANRTLPLQPLHPEESQRCKAAQRPRQGTGCSHQLPGNVLLLMTQCGSHRVTRPQLAVHS